jgi:Preprotein translocase subunit SecB
MDKTVSNFSFLGYRIDYINYSINPQFKSTRKMDVQLKLNVHTKADEEHSKGTVTIEAEFFKDNPEKYPFTLKLSITGNFSMDNPTDGETLRKRIKLNGTTALFPFLRSAVADITKSANIQPLIMPLINIHRLLEKQEQDTQDRIE